MADPKKFGTKAWLLLLLECKKSNPNLIFSFKYCNPSLSRIWPNTNTLKWVHCNIELNNKDVAINGFLLWMLVLKDKPCKFYVFSFNLFLSLCLIYFLLYIFSYTSSYYQSYVMPCLTWYQSYILSFLMVLIKKKGKGHIISVWFSPVSVYLFNCFTLPHVKWITMKTFNFPSQSDGICHKRCTCALFLPGKHHRNLMHFNPPKRYKLNLIKNVIFVLQNG